MVAVRHGTYRYLSPVVQFDDDRQVIGLSSISLVNNPNLPLSAPALNSETTMTDTDDTTTQTTQLAEPSRAVEVVCSTPSGITESITFCASCWR